MRKEELFDTFEGISEKYINEAETVHLKKKTPIWIKWMSVAACLCLCFCCAVPIMTAAGNDFAGGILYMLSPYIAQKLRPVNISCEDQGIEMTVVAAEVDGEKATILVSMRDNTGNRVDETTDLFDSYSIRTPYDQGGGCSLVSYDDATKTATFMLTINQMDHVLIPGDKITFSVSRLLFKKEISNFKLTQINTEEVPQITEVEYYTNLRVRSGFWGEDRNSLMLMKPDETNAVCLKNGVHLTGYGIVDGKLHIQLRFDDIRNTDNHGYVYLKKQNGGIIECDSNYSFWDENLVNDYEEYIFSVTPEEIADCEIWGDFWTCNSGPVNGNWQVTFPISGAE